MAVFNFTPGRFIFVKAFNNEIKIFPGKYAVEENDAENFVWENVNNAFLQYLSPDSELSEFNQDNSAFIALRKTDKSQSNVKALPELGNSEESSGAEAMAGKDDASDNSETEDELFEVIVDENNKDETADNIEENKQEDSESQTLAPDFVSGPGDGDFEIKNMDSGQVGGNSQTIKQDSDQEKSENETENQDGDSENDRKGEDNLELSGVYEKIKSLFSYFDLFAIFNKNSANAEEKLLQQSVIFSDFSVPFEYKDREINSLNLYLSLAARSAQENDNLFFEYSLGETWEQISVLELNQEYSNSVNGGYFNFQLSEIIGWEEIEDLKIRISYNSNSPRLAMESNAEILDFFVFLDSLWIEIEYDDMDEEQEISESDYIPQYKENFNGEEAKDDDLSEYSVDLLNTKVNFKITENPELNFRYKKNKNLINKIISGLISPFSDEYNHIKISADLRDARGDKTELKPEVRYISEGEFLVKIPENIREFRPGKYFFEIEIEDKGEIYQISQNFNWGVLAINVNKAVYRPGERAYLQMGVLDDFGHTLCDADLFLEITAPSDKTDIFSTDDNTIFKNSECAGDTVISGSDYYSYYSVFDTGIYRIKLRAETENGIREIYDEFKVESVQSFELERIGPTRIFPLADYEMKIIMRANESFQGNLVEYVPGNFKITNYKLHLSSEYKQITNEDISVPDSLFLIQGDEIGKKLIWQNLDIKPGDILEFTYTFDAPDVSPEFYLLGPLKLVDEHYFNSGGKNGQLVFEEERQWQVASDAVAEYDANGGSSVGTWVTPSYAWNSVNNDYAIRDIPKKSASEEYTNYLIADSNTATDLGYTINSVEIGLEAYMEDLQADITVYVQPYFGGTASGTSYGFAQSVLGTSDEDVAHYYDVTNDANAPSPWTWSDIINLDIKLWGINNSNSRQRMFYIDQLSIMVNYTEPNDPPVGAFNSATQKRDGDGVVDISMDVGDPDNDDVKAILQYVQGSGCDFSSPQDPTLDETDGNTTASNGDPKVENDNFYQIGNSSGWIKTDTGTNTVQFDWDTITDLPSGNDTYCLRLYINDDNAASSTAATTTLTIDNVAPTVPGDLSVFATSGTSVILTFGAVSAETNFSEYVIYYKQYDGSSPIESDSSWASTSDSNLDNINYGSATSTEITDLFPATQYIFNIWVYDEYGHKASATNNVIATTSSQLVPPVTTINSVTQKTDGSGVVDISLEVDDGNDDDARVRVDYEIGTSCDFISPLDPVLDESAVNISADFGNPVIDNDIVYQVGTTTGGWIETNSGVNTVQFDWLSRGHDPDLDGDYCIQFTANDLDSGDQITPVNTTVTIDNTNPSVPGAMSVATSTATTITLNFGAESGDAHFKEYKIYYKYDYSGVTEADNAYNKSDDANLDEADFNGAATTTISNLLPETTYYFVIYAYDDYGNKVGSTEISGLTAEADSIRSRTVRFLAGTYSGSGGIGQNSDVNQTFSGFNFSLAENEVEIKNAYIIFDAQYESYANNSENYIGYNLTFDACQESCTADAFSGSGRVLKDDNTILSYDETESNQIRLLLDVTDETQLSAYTGGNVNMEAQIGYRLERGASADSISYANAVLVVTYTYNHSNSDSFTNTVFYPLESNASGDSGTRRSIQINGCTRDSNCPTFDYQVDIPEIGKQLNYWFEVNLLNYDNNQTKTDDVGVDVNIEGQDINSYTFYHENANAGGQGNMPSIYFGQFANFGFNENTAQILEVYANSVEYDYYLMGGEVAETYTASTSASTKTRTVSFPFGAVNNGNTTSQTNSAVQVYFPENGKSSGVVTIKKAWIRAHSGNYSLADVNLTISTKVGDNIQSGNFVYNYFPGQVNIAPPFKITHVIQSSDYGELALANSNTAKDVTIYTTNSSVNQGGLSAELMITYTYTDEANGYLASIDLFAGQTDENGNSQSATSATANLVFSEQVGIKTIRAAAMHSSMLLNDSDGAMPSGNFTIDVDISSTTPSCSNAYITGADGTNAYVEFYKDVKARLSAIDNLSYTVCYSNSGGGDDSAGGKMNSALVYTYQYDVQPAVLKQNDWRWYENIDAVQPTSAKADENTNISNINLADILRLRINIGATKEDLAISSKMFKLQYGQGGDCTAITGWNDVGGISDATLWRGYDNSSISDGDASGSVLLSTSNVFESYEEENSSIVNPTTIPQNNAGEWDWALYNYSATSSSDYCFRAVNGDGSLLNFYNSDSYAKLTTAATNTRPNTVFSLEQFKNIGTTTIANTAWINVDSVRLRASVTDVNINENLSLYFQLVQNIGSFTTATTEPSSACLNGTAYGACGSNIWVATSTIGDYRTDGFTATATIAVIPDLSSGYKWQVLACDDDGECSEWSQFNTGPNFRVDITAPTAPGNLILASTTASSFLIDFGASTTEDNFKEYRIFYKEGDSDVTELNNEHNDPDLGYKDYNSTADTLVESLSAGTQYVFNIWAYDFAGNSASATIEMIATTTSSFTPPTGSIFSLSQKTDGSGAIDIAIKADDGDNDNTLRAKVFYEAGSGCVFSPPLDMTIDATDENVSATYGDPDVDNTSEYQVGTTSGWILTSPGENFVFFDWLSKTEISGANGTYCIGLIVSDGIYVSSPTGTSQILIDNLAPSTPGALTLNDKNKSDITMNFGGQSSDSRFDRYRIFYSTSSLVTVDDYEHDDANLLLQDYGGAATTTISDLEEGEIYYINIWAYDDLGNRASSSQLTVTTNSKPKISSNLTQYKQDEATLITNGAWTDESEVRLLASSTDPDTSEVITLYFELLPSTGTFKTATSEPSGACVYGAAYGTCDSKIWFVASSSPGDFSVNPYMGTTSITAIPDSDTGYKWQVLACDDDGDCANEWAIFDAGTPNFKIDTVAPTNPGILSEYSKTSGSITLSFGATTTEENFTEYIVYYDISSPVNESGTVHGSTTDSNLVHINFNGVETTLVEDLLPNTQYHFVIYAYDEVGHKASSSEISIITNAVVSTPGAMFYIKNDRVLYYRVWTGSAWNAEQSGPTLGSAAGDNISHIRAERSDDGARIAILAKTWDGTNQEWWGTVYRVAADDFVNSGILGSAYASADNNQLITGCIGALSSGEFVVIRNNNGSAGTLVFSWDAGDGWTSEGAGPGSTVGEVDIMNGCRLARRTSTDNYLLITFDDTIHGGGNYGDVGTSYYYGGSSYNNSSWTVWFEHSSLEEDIDNYVGEAFFDPSDNTRGAINYSNSNSSFDAKVKKFIVSPSSPYISYGAEATSPATWSGDFVHGEFGTDPNGVGTAWFAGDDINGELNIYKIDITNSAPSWTASANGDNISGTGLYSYTSDSQKPYAIQFYKDGYGTVAWNEAISATPKYRIITASTNTIDAADTAVSGAEANIYTRARFYKDPNENEFVAIYQNDDVDYSAIFWDGTNDSFYSSGNQAWTELVTASGAVDADYEAATFAFSAGNATPNTPTNLIQYKSDASTTIANGAWTDENTVKLVASSKDADTSEVLSVYAQLIADNETFSSTTTHPINACAVGVSFTACNSKTWLVATSSGDYSANALVATATITLISDSDVGYKWQVMACDDDSACSGWAKYNLTQPNFYVDTIDPTVPGELEPISKTSTSIDLDFGATTTEDNFSEYKIFYSETMPITELSSEHDDSDLDNILFNGTSGVSVTSLTPNTLYYFNIWAYDFAGNVASSTVVSTTTNTTYNLVQTSYLLENDDALDVNSNTSETTFDNPLNNINIGERMNVRIQLENNGGDTASTKVYSLQYENQTDNPGTWINVGVATEISYSLGLSGDNGHVVSSAKAAANSNTFAFGAWHEDTYQTGSFSLINNYYTEFVFAIETGNALTSKTYRLRLYNETDNKVLDGYNSTSTFSTVATETKKYSKEELDSLLTTTADLKYYFDGEGYDDVSTDDNTNYDENGTTTANYAVINFATKHTNNTDAITVTWNGQSSASPVYATVYLQVYQYGSINSWITMASNSTAATGTDFTISANLNSSLSEYYGASNWTYWRVYQDAGNQNLKSDYFNAGFAAPVSESAQIHYRWRNDDGSETTGDWLEIEDTGSPTASSSVEIGDNIRLRIEMANTGGGDATNYNYRLEYATTTGNCSTDPGNWLTVPTDSSGHWQMATSSYFADSDPSTAQLNNTESYSFVAGDMVEYPSNSSGNISLSEGWYTEIEYVIKATINAQSAGTYCLRATNAGTPMDAYDIFPVITLSGVTNTSPFFTLTGEPIDNNSASTSPTAYGQAIVFDTTANDDESDDYYLAICKTDNITAGNDGPPICGGGEWCISELASSTDSTTCSYTTATSTESLEWYGFVCDKYPGFAVSKCSASSQGDDTAANNSPFVINHPPIFTSISTTDDNKDPGGIFTLTAIASDSDAVGGADTLQLYVCYTDDAGLGGCTGGPTDTVCSGASSSPNIECVYTDTAPSTSSDITYYAFVFDGHNLASDDNSNSNTYTINNVASQLGNLVLNNGVDIGLNIKPATTTVQIVSTSVEDQNGCSTIQSAVGRAYMSNVTGGYNCTADDNDCYHATIGDCVKNCTSDTTTEITCSVAMKYFAIPTADDAVNNPNESYDWRSYMQVYDGANYSFATSTGVEVGTVIAFEVLEELIDFGTSMFAGENTGTVNSTTTVVNCGNSPIDTRIKGTDLSGFPSGSLGVTNIKWNLDNFVYATETQTLTTSEQLAHLFAPRATSAIAVEDLVLWGIGIPPTADASTYTGQNIFKVKLDSDNW
ncbi:hypothetical protein KAU09_04030 [Candidatus Parcubacteria bacterium]|nr:hypothetical protein [Candidatus Parcubacteria bacterium]